MKRLLLALAMMAAAASAAIWLYPPLQGAAAHLIGLKPSSELKAAKKSAPPPAVTAAPVELADMPIILSAPGTVEARATVNVKPRVDGQIAEVLFKEGDLVKEGQVLFRLDDRLARAQIEQAAATIKRDEATLADAEATYARRVALIEKKIVSEASMDTAKAVMNALRASIAAGKANLDAQRTQLDYLTIAAPITGRTGSTTFKPGANIRAADTTPLVVINQTQPVNVTFALPQTDIVALRKALTESAKAKITIPGQKPVERDGTLAFLDNQVDKGTGTLTAKVMVVNDDEALWPGLAVEVALTVEIVKDVPAVPVSAVLPSQQGMLTWVIAADKRVSPRQVTLARVVGQRAYVTDGLKQGERVVTDGQGRIGPNMIVNERSTRDSPAPASGETRSSGSKS